MKNSIKSFSKARSRSSFKNKQILSKANEIFFVTEDNFEDFKFLNEDPFKLNLEIGFGDGKYLTEHALNNPKQSFIGIEVFESGLANTYKKIEKLNITNLKLIQGDVSEIFSKNKSKNLFDLITIFFPDPWPKSKHKKRRLLKKNFFLILKSLLKKEVSKNLLLGNLSNLLRVYCFVVGIDCLWFSLVFNDSLSSVDSKFDSASGVNLFDLHYI